MTRIIMHGCSGYMGKVITQLCEKDPSFEIVAGIDVRKDGNLPYPVFESLEECDIPADALVDFSTAGALDGLFTEIEKRKIPAVICTTGLSDAQQQRLNEVSAATPVLKSANMSLGVNVLLKLVKDAARVLSPAGFDMEIVEKHHRRKMDAPSGTALALADSINQAMDYEFTYTYDRSRRREPRAPKEIGISAVRGGTIVGEHDVIFAGEDEVVELHHTALSRAIFGKGALEAARFLVGKEPGFYSMQDVIESTAL